MSEPIISVITSTYNDGPYLREAVDSILNQTFTDFEYIIVDDASTDETPQILASYDDPRIVVLRNEENLGRGGARNRAIEKARGEYIAIMDGDDVSMLDRFEKQIEYLVSHPEIEYLGSGIQYISGAGGFFPGVWKVPETPGAISWLLCFTYPFIHSTTMARRSIFDRFGLYNPAFLRSQDMELWSRILPEIKCANLPAQLLKVRVKISNRDFQLPDTSYARRVHHQYNEKILGRNIPKEISNILWNTSQKDQDQNSVPISTTDAISAMKTLVQLYEAMDRQEIISRSEESFIQEDLIIRASKIITNDKFFSMEFLGSSKTLRKSHYLTWRYRYRPQLARILNICLQNPKLALQLLRKRIQG